MLYAELERNSHGIWMTELRRSYMMEGENQLGEEVLLKGNAIFNLKVVDRCE